MITAIPSTKRLGISIAQGGGGLSRKKTLRVLVGVFFGLGVHSTARRFLLWAVMVPQGQGFGGGAPFDGDGMRVYVGNGAAVDFCADPSRDMDAVDKKNGHGVRGIV